MNTSSVGSLAGRSRMTFTAPGVEIELMMLEDGERRLVGQLVPAAEATIMLETTDATHETTAESLGRFGFADVDGGLMRLTVVSNATRRDHPLIHALTIVGFTV